MSNSPWLTLVPAYGRDYKSAEAVLADWVGSKDFRIQDVSAGPGNGRYCSCRDGEPGSSLDGYTFKIRYSRLANIALLRRVKAKWRLVGKLDEESP